MNGGCISVWKAHWMLSELIITGDMCSTPKAQLVKKKIPCARKGYKGFTVVATWEF